MKKLFLAGIAALFLATGPAHANERVKDALPSSLSGVWCYQKFESQFMRDIPIVRPAEGRFPMKTIANVLGVARSHLHES
jgi:hypothetical protein